MFDFHALAFAVAPIIPLFFIQTFIRWPLFIAAVILNLILSVPIVLLDYELGHKVETK